MVRHRSRDPHTVIVLYVGLILIAGVWITWFGLSLVAMGGAP